MHLFVRHSDPPCADRYLNQVGRTTSRMDAMAIAATSRVPRGRVAAPKQRALALLAVFLLAAVGGGKPAASSFVSLLPSSQRGVAARVHAVARCAEEDATGGTVTLEEPPPDEQLIGNPRLEEQSRPGKKYRPKREIRGTLCYAHRELREEAERFQHIIEPLLKEKQLSIKELTFVLNRQGSKLRHLLYKPRQSLPVFTEHKVHRLCKRARDAQGIKLHKYLRPQELPPHAPAAPYPRPIPVVFAEVPPLRFLSKRSLPQDDAPKNLPPAADDE